jgi:hypothetical protein
MLGAVGVAAALFRRGHAPRRKSRGVEPEAFSLEGGQKIG